VAHALNDTHTTESLGASGEDFDALDRHAAVPVLAVREPGRTEQLCRPAERSAQPTQVDGSDCSQGTQACGGADYLMFWQLTDLSRGNLSPQEGQVMRLNPLVRPL
jgi:hypothetical protein